MWESEFDDEGNRSSRFRIRRDENDAPVDDEAVDDEEDDDDEKRDRGRNWSKTMSVYSGWYGTKKLLAAAGAIEKEKEVKASSYDGGGALKKSVSTGGFVGS